MFACPSYGQLGMFSKKQRIDFTRAWRVPRFPDGRPDVKSVIDRHGIAEGRIRAQDSWVIDMFEPGDVLVINLFGKIKEGTIIL